MPSIDSVLPVVLAVLALLSVVAAVLVASPAVLGYGCGGPQGADLDRTSGGDWLVLSGGSAPADEYAVVARYGSDWRELARYDVELPANATAEDQYATLVSLAPAAPPEDGFWIVASDGTAYRFGRNGSFTGESRPAGEVDEANDPAVSAPADAIDWEDEQYGDAVDVERGDDRHYVLAKDGTVLEYTTDWQYTGVTHEAVDANDCYGERPKWPSAWELLVASNAVGFVGLALASVLARADLRLAAALAVGGPILAGTFSMYLLPDPVGAVYRLPDLAIGLGLLAPIAAAGWWIDEDPVVSLPLLSCCGATLVSAGVRYLLASGVP